MKTKRFRHYTGSKRWRVEHPDYPGGVEVLAPDEEAAIAAAASLHDRRWQDVAWYAYARATRLEATA